MSLWFEIKEEEIGISRVFIENMIPETCTMVRRNYPKIAAQLHSAGMFSLPDGSAVVLNGMEFEITKRRDRNLWIDEKDFACKRDHLISLAKDDELERLLKIFNMSPLDDSDGDIPF